MKLKKLIFPAILLTILGGTVKFCDTFLNVYGDGFFMNSRTCNFVFAGIMILLFVIAFALSIADRKKEFHAEPQKNFWCGAFGFLASITLIGGGVIGILSFKGDNLFANITAVAAGFVLLYEACISFTGQNGMKKLPVLALILPIWCCARFIEKFVEYSHYALEAREIFDIIEIGFLIMFLFYQAMFFAGINNKTAIRRAVVYGTVMMMLALIVPIDMFIKMAMGGNEGSIVDSLIVEPTITNIIAYVGDLAFCAYAFFFTREILNTAEKNLVKPADGDEKAVSLDGAEVVASDEKETKPEAETEVKSETESGAEAEAEAEAETETETETVSETETESETEAEAQSESEEKKKDSGSYDELLDILDKA